MVTGMLAREEPLVISITTAGMSKKTFCFDMYQAGKKLEAQGLEAMREAGFFFRWYSTDKPAKDRTGWMEANPSSWIDVKALQADYEKLPEYVFKRWHLNQWTEALESWLPVGVWDDAADKLLTIPEGSDVTLGVDLGLKYDSSAIVIAYAPPQGTKDKDAPPMLWIKAKIFDAPNDGTSLDITIIEQAIRDLAGKYNVVSVAYDAWNFAASAQQLESEGLLMVEFPLTNARTVPASAALYEAIINGRLKHDGDKVLAEHVANGVTRHTDRGWRLAKTSKAGKIDALIAMMMACYEANQNEKGGGFYFETITY